MRILPPPEPSILTAFFCAPLITPILAIPLVALLPGIYNNELEFLILIPFVAFFSLLYGYLGMLLVCLPIILLLRFLERLDATRLCFFTTVVGGGVWAWLFQDSPGPEPATYLAKFIVGAGCSLGVSAFFCLLAGISIHASRARPGAQIGPT